MNNNKYTTVKDTNNYLKYSLNNYTGERLKFEKKEFSYYRKIKVPGYKVHSYSNHYIIYTVEKQTIRKIKMMSLDDNFKSYSHEARLLRMLQKSEELENEYDNNGISWQNYTISSYNNYYDYNEYDYKNDIEDRKEKKKYANLQSKQYAQKIKQYNNVRNRR